MNRITKLPNAERSRIQGVMAAGLRRNQGDRQDEASLLETIQTPPPPAQPRDELERQILDRASARSLRAGTVSFASFFFA
jgi:hypothetical protein